MSRTAAISQRSELNLRDHLTRRFCKSRRGNVQLRVPSQGWHLLSCSWWHLLCCTASVGRRSHCPRNAACSLLPWPTASSHRLHKHGPSLGLLILPFVGLAGSPAPAWSDGDGSLFCKGFRDSKFPPKSPNLIGGFGVAAPWPQP